MSLMNNEILSVGAKHSVSYPTPSNMNYFWGFGSISGFLLMNQVLSGVLMAMHYSPEVSLAFNSIEHIMRDVTNGWLFRYMHSGGASMFFMVVYMHIGRALYFSSYSKIALWYSGVMMFILMMATAFMGYVLPWGQMSLWGATVMTNLFGAMPLMGSYIVSFLWGGFAVDNPTLKSFFVMHFLLPLVLLAMSAVHLALLHIEGSTNPLGICSKMDILKLYPKFISKDMFGFFVVVGNLALMTVFWYPNLLGHPDNYMSADALVTPKHIVPEWYFLPFYAMLSAIPNKLGGVLVMGASMAILALLPFLSEFKCKSSKFVAIWQFFFWSFICNVLLLGWLGACLVEEPFVILSQMSTVTYFMYFLFIIPFLSYIEKKALM